MTARVKKPVFRAADPIGVFDSGMGGLSILSHLRKQLPRERFIFLADQSHVPYGAKTGAQLTTLTSRITRFLLARRAKLIVVACNTATCYAIGHLRARFSVPFIGTVPAVKPACEESRSRTVAVLSTPATARSAALRDLVNKFADHCTVLRIGCPGLEEAVEHGRLEAPGTLRLLERYAARARRAGADRIVLGCTHYPFLKTHIRRITGARTVDSGAAVARQTRNVLTGTGFRRRTGSGSVAYWTTGDARDFSRVASALLRRRVSARKAKI
ncbi:MAG TPA: glutamate racemase [Candidatus Paceibacterota bacterium]|nr:glutamate racemase [Candidatus Paceibacterota bacterium]